MQKKLIGIFVLVLFLVIVILVVMDYSSTRPDRRGGNPYEFSADIFTAVDPALVTYREIRQIITNAEQPKAIGCQDDRIYLLADRRLQVLDLTGRQIHEKSFPDEPRCIAVPSTDTLVIGFENYICLTDGSGNVLFTSPQETDSSIFTSVATNGNTIYVADAGKQRVLMYSRDGLKKGEFEGESGSASLHGFIVPSPYFDLDVNHLNELWVVNPGMLALQSYDDRGSLMNHWEKASVEIDGFSGCCNPAHFAFLDDGAFVTSEKGLVRIKVYDPSGEFVAVVAPPDKFTEEGEAPDLAVGESGKIIALDYDKRLIRIFEPR
ncbi:MAG: hypothetical protein JXA61_06235 [Bacteroidales bacterium]|nr:hypothetical protein [Bacteroidales bacterium]